MIICFYYTKTIAFRETKIREMRLFYLIYKLYCVVTYTLLLPAYSATVSVRRDVKLVAFVKSER